MHLKNSLLTLFLCGVFQYTVGTGILLNALKNTVQNTSFRCTLQLHNLGSKIIQYDHDDVDPCGQPKFSHDDHGSNKYGSVGHGNIDFGSSGYGSNKLEPQNGYQLTKHLDGVRSHGYGNRQDLLENKQEPEHNYNGHLNGSLNEEKNHNTFNVSTTRRYQFIVNKDKNIISKVNTSNGFKSQDVHDDIDNDYVPYETYSSEPRDAERKNVFKVSCPNGSTPTNDGECLYEFK